MNTQLSLMDFFNVGAHRGNHKSRLNPRLKSYIHSVDRNSICIIDLVKTMSSLNKAMSLMHSLGSKKRQVFVVGTSKYLGEYTTELAKTFTSETMPYVENRWLGGTLTNWPTVRKTLKTLDKLESIFANKEFYDKLSRNEQLNIARELEKKQLLFGGLKNLKTNRPGAILVLDSAKNQNAILEAEVNNIPIIALSNLNTILLPKSLEHSIIFNNTSMEAIRLITGELAKAFNDGFVSAQVPIEATKKTV